MEAPDELAGVVRNLQQRQPHERRSREVEASLSIRREKGTEPRLLRGRVKLPPVLLVEEYLDVLMHNLKRTWQSLMAERRAQQRVAIYDLLPRSLEGRESEVATDDEAKLYEVRLGRALQQRMKEQALLNRGKRINIRDMSVVAQRGCKRGPIETCEREFQRRRAISGRTLRGRSWDALFRFSRQ